MSPGNPAHPAPAMKTKGRLSPLVWQAPVAAVIITLVWLLLEVVSRRVGIGPAMILSLLLFGASAWGLTRLRRM